MALNMRTFDTLTRPAVTVRIGLSMALLALSVMTGCPDDQTAGAVDSCEEIGQQCKLGGGQLGVCSMNPDGEMTCEPQH
jgi:hypothetical protein